MGLDLKLTAVNYQRSDVESVSMPEENSKEDLFGQAVIYDSFIDKEHQFLSLDNMDFEVKYIIMYIDIYFVNI